MRCASFFFSKATFSSLLRSTPEAVNRLVSDLLAEVLFTTSPEADGRSLATGAPAGRVRFVGQAGERIADEIVGWLAARKAGGPGTAGSAA